jgi:hypothetical protein
MKTGSGASREEERPKPGRSIKQDPLRVALPLPSREGGSKSRLWKPRGCFNISRTQTRLKGSSYHGYWQAANSAAEFRTGQQTEFQALDWRASSGAVIMTGPAVGGTNTLRLPIINAPKRLTAVGPTVPDIGTTPWTASGSGQDRSRVDMSAGGRQRLCDAVTVLTRARELLADEQRWCKRSFARTWLCVPVCTRAPVLRPGRHHARRPKARQRRPPCLEWRTVRPIPDWNDERRRTHGEVIAAFDAAIATLDRGIV